METSPKPPTTPQGRKGALQEAVEYVSKPWIPVNSELLQQIQRNISVGFYDESAEKLVNDVKKDFSLFTYCLKSMKTLAGSTPVTSSPIEFLKQQEVDHLKQLLSVPEEQITTHRFDPNAKLQAQRIKHSLISASTAEVLAAKSQINPELAFSCAQLRQLGLTLIAYNYPRVYTKALSAMKEHGGHLEEILYKTLGYSPTELGVKVAAEWNVCPELMGGLKTSTYNPLNDQEMATVLTGDEAYKVTGDALSRFCQIGETLARAGDDHYPNAAKNWETAQSEITRILGPGGLAMIRNKIGQMSSSYQVLGDDLIKFEIGPPRVVKSGGGMFAGKLYNDNIHLKRCSQVIQDHFRNIYEHMEPGDISIEAVNILITDTIPFLGFPRGCAFLVDEQKMMVVPSLRIGDCALTRYKPMSCSAIGDTSNPVIDALSYSAPILQEKAFLFGDMLSHITGSFGNNEKTGVLFLEMSDELISSERGTILLYFKAVKHCLNDCLNLKP